MMAMKKLFITSSDDKGTEYGVQGFETPVELVASFAIFIKLVANGYKWNYKQRKMFYECIMDLLNECDKGDKNGKEK